RRDTKGGLYSASSAVPVLRLNLQFAAHASLLGRHDRAQWRRRQSSVRHPRLFRRRECRKLSRRELPESTGISGWTRRLLDADRRKKLSRPGDYFSRAAARLAEHC